MKPTLEYNKDDMSYYRITPKETIQFSPWTLQKISIGNTLTTH